MTALSEPPGGPPLLPLPHLLDDFLEAVPDSVYFKDRDGRFLAVSLSKAKRHGFSERTRINGLTDFDLFGHEHAERSRSEEIEIMTTGQPMLNRLHRLIWPDGRQGWGLTSKMPLHNQQGEVVGTFGLTRDITDLKRVEQELERSQRSLLEASHLAGMAEVASGVLHNVGNVLTSLNVSVETIRQRVAANSIAKLPQVVGLLRGNLSNLTAFLTEDPKGKLILDYLDALAHRETEHQRTLLAEIDAMNTHIAHIGEIVAMQQSYATIVAITEETSPADVWEDAIRLNAAAIARHGLKIVRDFSPCPAIVVQKGKLLQILVNLIQNAKNACADAEPAPTERLLTLRAMVTETGVRFSIIDAGVGIAAENLPKLFQQGFTTRKTGHGFGLHSCAVIAQQMGGTLSAASAGLGLGATFTLDLPLRPPEGTATHHFSTATENTEMQRVPEARFIWPSSPA